MVVDHTGRLIASKNKLVTLLRTAIDDASPSVGVQVERTERDELGCNWTARLDDDPRIRDQCRKEFLRIVLALRAAYALPSERDA